MVELDEHSGAATGALWIADARTRRMRYVSAAARALFNVEKLDTVDDLTMRLVDSGAATLAGAFCDVARTGGSRACAHTLVRADGERRAIRTELFGVGDQVIAYNTDATAPHAHNGQLELAARALDTIASTGPFVVFTTDAHGLLRYVRAAPQSRLGSQRRAEGMSVLELYRDQPWVISVFERALAGQIGTASGDVDGRKWDLYCAPTRDHTDAVSGVVGMAVDSELRHNAEEALFKVFHASPVATSITRLSDGMYIDVNQSYVSLFGYSRTELIGKTSLGLGVWARKADRDAIVAILASQQHVHGYEAPGRTKGGRLVDTVVYMERIEVGKTPCLVSLVLDVTERRRAEQELQKLNDHLRELDALRARFVANVSHELRTPLSLVLGLVDRMLAGEDLPAVRQAEVQAIARNARIVLKHVNDLLDVSKLEAGAMRPDYADVDLARVVESAATSFALVGASRGIDVTTRLPPSLHGEVDPDMFARIASNLLSNALKFTPVGGRVRCSLAAEAQWALLEVADSGPGVPAAARAMIFERFVQLDRGLDRRFPGTGLGLPIARELAALHHGTIDVEDAPEGGALFRVALPLHAPEGAWVRQGVPVPETPADALVEAPPREPITGPSPPHELPRVLVVEDNVELARFIADALSARFDVVTALDGAEALRLVEESAPDALVTDLTMPGMSGEDLVRAIRQHGIGGSMPILVLTARAEDALRTRLLALGAQDYMLKPFSSAELVARVGSWTAAYRARRLLQEALASREVDLEKLAAELVKRRHELEVTAEALRVAREQAERASRNKSEFLGMVSHELRTPLTIIKLQADALSRHASSLPKSDSTPLERIDRSCARLLALVESLLEYARSQTGRVRPHAEPFDLAACVGEVVDTARAEAQRKGLDVHVDLPPGLPLLRSDRHLVRIIVMNLVTNAVRFTERGFVSVSVAAAGGEHVVTIADSGIGIPDAQHATIFEPFSHLEPIKNKHTPGFGIGLALVRQLLEVLQGSVAVRSRAGVGSTFTVRLRPLSEDASGRLLAELSTEPTTPDQRGGQPDLQ